MTSVAIRSQPIRRQCTCNVLISLGIFLEIIPRNAIYESITILDSERIFFITRNAIVIFPQFQSKSITSTRT